MIKLHYLCSEKSRNHKKPTIKLVEDNMINDKTSSVCNSTVYTTKEKTANKKQAELGLAIYNKVIFHLEEKQAFLDPKLSLIRLSSVVGTNTSLSL